MGQTAQGARERTAVLKHHMTFHHPTALDGRRRPIWTDGDVGPDLSHSYRSVVHLAGGQFMDQVANSLFFSVRGIARITRAVRSDQVAHYTALIVWWST